MRKPIPHLTRAHVERVHRDVPDPGPVAYPHLTEEDYKALAASLVAEMGDDPLRVFAYGSLIWKPAVEFGPGTPATLFGWHRAFCLKLLRFRGTPEQPGLMMALDRGGSCKGLVFPVHAADPLAEVETLLRREMTTKPPTNFPRWVRVMSADGPVRAIAFTASRAGLFYQPQLSPHETAIILAQACGHWGSGADYLLNTVEHLALHGIHDRNLWVLQRLVAEAIDAGER